MQKEFQEIEALIRENYLEREESEETKGRDLYKKSLIDDLERKVNNKEENKKSIKWIKKSSRTSEYKK